VLLASAASLFCVRSACCRCGTNLLINFTRSDVSNDSVRLGAATMKHVGLGAPVSRTNSPSSNSLGQIQSA
jgi:hypothetical protein